MQGGSGEGGGGGGGMGGTCHNVVWTKGIPNPTVVTAHSYTNFLFIMSVYTTSSCTMLLLCIHTAGHTCRSSVYMRKFQHSMCGIIVTSAVAN